NATHGGIVRPIHPRRITDVADGTSCTLLAGEARMNPNTVKELQSTDDQGFAAGWDGDTVGRTDLQPGVDNGAVLPGRRDRPVYGSSHPGRFNAVFVDGSVRPISYGIRLEVLKALGDIRDGKLISLQDL